MAGGGGGQAEVWGSRGFLKGSERPEAGCLSEFPEIVGPQCRPQNTVILNMGAPGPKKSTLILVNLHTYGQLSPAWAFFGLSAGPQIRGFIFEGSSRAVGFRV